MTKFHLTFADRLEIEAGLKNGLKFTEIASKLGKSKSTISKEIKRHRYKKPRNVSYYPNVCVYRIGCDKSKACSGRCFDRSKCRKCSKCNSVCVNFKETRCPKLIRSPLVCNGCSKIVHCSFDKMLYDARKAQNDYETDLRDSRVGINMDEANFIELRNTVCPLVLKGHSVASIVSDHPELGVSPRTIYSYIEQGVLPIKNIDLIRKVRYKRRHNRAKATTKSSWRIGRSYKDYKEFKAANGSVMCAQMDTVEGIKGIGQKVLLTLIIPEFELLFAFLLERKTQHDVKMALDSLELRIGKDNFQRLFPVILTDNGIEFQNPDLIESSALGGIRTKVFYAEPYSSYQKGSIENCHEMIRRFIPKGFSFNDLTDIKVNNMINNIDNYPRKSLDWQTPYQKAKKAFGSKLLRLLGLKKIEPDKVDLTPYLLTCDY